MIKLQSAYVAMAVLFLGEDRHSDEITEAAIDSDLSELGYKGGTPKRTMNALLNSSKGYSEYFISGRYTGHYCLADRAAALDHDDVRVALFALCKQRRLHDLKRNGIVEFTFRGDDLVAVRNPHVLLTAEGPDIEKVLMPRSVSKASLDKLLPHRTGS